MQINIAVVEDDDFTRVMIASALRAAGINVAFEAATAAEALSKIKSVRVDAAVMDLHLGKGPTGLDLAVAFRGLHPGIGLVILTSYADPRLLHPGLPEFPAGTVYLIKSEIADLAKLSEAIKIAIESAQTGRSIGVGSNNKSKLQLTDGQIETLRLIGKGYSNAEIAKQRFVTEKSVEVAIVRLAKKLGVERSQTQNQRVHMAKTVFRAIGMKFDE